MTAKRKNVETSTSDLLERAIQQVQAEGKRMSVSEVARIAEVDPSLIHKCYPIILAKIRSLGGAVLRKTVDDLREELAVSKRMRAELEKEVNSLKDDLAKLASINLTLSSKPKSTLRSKDQA